MLTIRLKKLRYGIGNQFATPNVGQAWFHKGIICRQHLFPPIVKQSCWMRDAGLLDSPQHMWLLVTFFGL